MCLAVLSLTCTLEHFCIGIDDRYWSFQFMTRIRNKLFLLLITSLKTAKIKGALKSMKNLKKYTTVIRRMLKCFSDIQTESFSLRI